jgi:sugar phosphate isomerase/epimerase
MNRREFVGAAAAAAIEQGLPRKAIAAPLKPMALGLLIAPFGAPEEKIRRVHELGFTNCFLSLDRYLGQFTPALAVQFKEWLDKYEVTATTVEVVGPQPLVWNFLKGPATIGLVPRAMRAARIDALKQASDFAKLLGVGQVQTHCGFIPENPDDPLYAETVEAIKTVAAHCKGNGQWFLMETGQETPTTSSRVLRDACMDNLGIGLDTANVILYGKANPVDAAEILGPHVRAIHAKDGLWPTDPSQLGREVLIGQGKVDFKRVFTILKAAGYTGAVTIERETSGPQQIEDVKKEKAYLEAVLREVLRQGAGSREQGLGNRD